VLLADEAHRDLATVAVDDAGAEDFFAEENAFGVVAQRPVPHVR